jgi:hypothetical protein
MTSTTIAAEVPGIDRRTLLTWEIAGGTVVLLVGAFLHFAYELAGFQGPAAIIGSVNESTWEHMKLFVWPGLGYAVTQHAFLRQRLNNFWLAHASALWLTTLANIVAFYAYVGVVVPISGKGTLAGTIVTAIVGIAIGRWSAYRLLRAPERGPRSRLIGIGLILLLLAMVVLFTYAPPHIFLFENFFGYRYSGEFGILVDYEPYRVFK